MVIQSVNGRPNSNPGKPWSSGSKFRPGATTADNQIDYTPTSVGTGTLVATGEGGKRQV